MPKQRSNGASPAARFSAAYSGSSRRGLWSGVRRLAPLAAALLALSAGGCSTSYQLGALIGKDEQKADRVASVSSPIVPASFDKVTDGDLLIAKAAAVDLFARDSKDASAPWENPRTGAHGNITPIAAAVAENGTVCRNFLASFVRGERETWYQGGACRKDRVWEVRDFRPLQRT
jgi:surface antigen